LRNHDERRPTGFSKLTRSRVMLKKSLLTLSLLLPLTAMSAASFAGTTISDKRYWPDEVGPGAHATSAMQSEPRSAFGSIAKPTRTEIAPTVHEGKNVW